MTEIIDTEATTETLGIQPEWAMALPIQMQSVLLLATRGPDGVRKHHESKHLIRAYRATVIKAAAAGVMLDGSNDVVYDTFIDSRIAFGDFWAKGPWFLAVDSYFDVLDELPHHYHLHFVHAAEILGYKHPDEQVRKRWMGFYLRCVDDMHLNPEIEAELDARLNDFGRYAQPVVERQEHNHDLPEPCSVACPLFATTQGIVALEVAADVPVAPPLAPGPSKVLCGQKQGGSNSPCTRAKGHVAPHNDGVYSW